MSPTNQPTDGDIHVLIVEDVDVMRELLLHAISEISGVYVTAAVSSIREAHLELSRRRPQVVLLDEILPGESSLDFVDALKSEGIAVVLLTGLKDRNHPLPDGAHSRHVKPGWKTLELDRPRFLDAIQQAAKKCSTPF